MLQPESQRPWAVTLDKTLKPFLLKKKSNYVCLGEVALVPRCVCGDQRTAVGVGSLLPCGSWLRKSGHRAWWQILLLPADPPPGLKGELVSIWFLTYTLKAMEGHVTGHGEDA